MFENFVGELMWSWSGVLIESWDINRKTFQYPMTSKKIPWRCAWPSTLQRYYASRNVVTPPSTTSTKTTGDNHHNNAAADADRNQTSRSPALSLILTRTDNRASLKISGFVLVQITPVSVVSNVWRDKDEVSMLLICLWHRWYARANSFAISSICLMGTVNIVAFLYQVVNISTGLQTRGPL